VDSREHDAAASTGLLDAFIAWCEASPVEVRDVVVVGAGPAGLAVAACLRCHGRWPLVLERGSVGESWRGRYDRLHLHTARRLSGLPGMPIPRSCGRWVARDDLVRYLEAYAKLHGLDVRTQTAVERIEHKDRKWELVTPAGRIASRAVVVATGLDAHPFLPAWPGRERFRGELVHSAVYRNAAPYRRRDVLVVGAGNSGAEIAVDLVEGGAARVHLSVRTPPNILRRDRFGVPTQVIGIAVGAFPTPVLDSILPALQRRTVPDLSAYGLPRVERPMSRYLATGTVPILDVGLIEYVRRGRVGVVPAVERLE
jgi:putative flavoprotein involved in K+ transport